MNPTIKICGITSCADARLCVDAGADRLGVIFAKSPRQVTVEQAVEIAAAVPDTPIVGVFDDWDPYRVADAVRTVDLAAVQLHGRTSSWVWEHVADVCRRPVIAALTPGQAAIVAADNRQFTLMLDLAKNPERRTEADRQRLLQMAARLCELGKSIVVAGGLDPDNVAEAILSTGCSGVDVCRGVERSPGQKDPELVHRFVSAVRNLERSNAS